MLAISALLTDAGYPDTATEFKEHAVTLITPRLLWSDSAVPKYTYASHCLALALIEHTDGFTAEHNICEAKPAPGKDSVENDSVEQDSTTIKSRTAVPFRHVLLAHLASSTFAFTNIAVWGLCVIAPAGMLFNFAQFDLEKQPWIGFFAPVILLLWILLPIGIIKGSRQLLARYAKTIDRIIKGLVHKYTYSSPRIRRAIIFRVLRYQTMLGNSAFTDNMTTNRPPWIPAIYRLLILRIRKCSEWKEVAQLISEAIGMSRYICDKLSVELRNMSPNNLEMILRKVAEHSQLRSDRWNWHFLRILVSTSTTVILPDLLFNAIHYPPERKSNDPPEDARKTTITLLQTLTPAHLAKVILASLYQPSYSDPPLLHYYASNLKAMAWKIHLAMKSPLHIAEPLLWIPLYLPGLLTILPIGFLLALYVSAFLLIVPGSMRLAGYSYDQLRLLSLPCGVPIWQHAEYVRTQINKVSDYSIITSFFGIGKELRETMLALQIIGEDFIESTTFNNYSIGERRRVLLELSRVGVMGQHADILLSVMGNRDLLVAASTLPHRRSKYSHVQQIGPQECDVQLRRVFPIRSRWHSLTLVMALSASFITIWMLALYMLMPTDNTIAQILLFTTLAFGIFFAVCQHMAPHEDMLIKGSIVGTVGGGILYFSNYILHIREAFLPLEFMGGAIALIITNWLSPRVIAGWQGAGLIFPNKTQLWAQRFVYILIAVGISVVLASICWLLIGTVQKSGLYN